MTFRPERYPANWRAISALIRERAGGRCECSGQCGGAHLSGRCDAPNHELIERSPSAPWLWRVHTHTNACAGERCGGSRVILTVAHVDHDEQNNAPENLLALCQRCHLVLDARDNAVRRRKAAAERAGQPELALGLGRGQ